MKTTILIHENEHWIYYPDTSDKIDHVSDTIADGCFFFDPVKCSSVTSVIPQPPTEEDPRAGHLMINLHLDADELDWFLDRPGRIKGLKEWLGNISKAEAKRYALDMPALPKKEIETKSIEFDAKTASLSPAEEAIVLQIMTAVIQSDNPDIFIIARHQRDDLIISVLKSLPKAFRKVEISMPWSSGMDAGRISITDEDKLPMLSKPMFVVTESSQKLASKFPEQFAIAEAFLSDTSLSYEKIEVSDIAKAIHLESKGLYEDAANVFKSEKFKGVWQKLHPHKVPQIKTGNAGNKPQSAQQKHYPAVKQARGAASAVQSENSVKKQAAGARFTDIILFAVETALLVIEFIYYSVTKEFFMDLFSLSFVLAFFAVFLSYLSEKYWTRDRLKAVLVNVGGHDHLNLEENQCDSDMIDLTKRFYQAEFGGPEVRFDGITLRVVIDKKLEPHDILAKVFLNDSRFVINGTVSVISGPVAENRDNEVIEHYDFTKVKNYTGSEEIKLYDNDLIYIKQNGKTVAAFRFLMVDDILSQPDKNRIRNKITVENQQPETSEEEQDEL